MAIVHIVLFEFKPGTQVDTIHDVCKRMVALQTQCIHPTSKQPYILKSSGGIDNSPEGHQGGFSHGFVSHFDNEGDRKYYLEQDPAHLAFVKSLDGIIQNVRVLDYTEGVF